MTTPKRLAPAAPLPLAPAERFELARQEATKLGAAMVPFFQGVRQAMDDFAAAVRRDPQLARLLEEHARAHGAPRG